MKNLVRIALVLLILAVSLAAQAQMGQPPQGGQPPQAGQQPQIPPVPEPIRQARQLTNQGKLDEALAAFQQYLKENPNSYEANSGAGIVLDLQGKYDEARKHLARAIEVAKPEQKAGALRSMGVSYAFDRKPKQIEQYHKQAFDMQMAKPDFIAAAEVANEMARLMLESGDINGAEKWYKTGYETALKKTDLSDADKDLWNFRWEHAQARIAARRGKKDEAQKHVAAAKAIIDRGVIDKQQAVFFPYLTGYVAFYTGDYKTALADLQNANQRDPFILALMAQAQEKSGNKDQAMELYRKILTMNIHNPTGAYARPLAKQKVGA